MVVVLDDTGSVVVARSLCFVSVGVTSVFGTVVAVETGRGTGLCAVVVGAGG